MSFLKKKYKDEIIPELVKEFGYKNKMDVPSLQKIVINMGIKEGVQDVKVLDQCADDLTMLSGQKAVTTRARKAISNFKLREGTPVGAKVTLRSKRMYEFLERFIGVSMPRIKDFQGVSNKSFDGRGNYSMGLTEQLIFPEVNFDNIRKTQGMNICFVTSAKTNEEAKKLLELLGIPFRKR